MKILTPLIAFCLKRLSSFPQSLASWELLWNQGREKLENVNE